MIRVAIFSDVMDRPARGTALVARKLVEQLTKRKEEFGIELYLVHSKKVNDPLYAQAHEVMMRQYRIPKIGRLVSEAVFLWRTRNEYDVIHYTQESIYPLFWLSNARVVVSVLSHLEGWRDFGLKVRYAMVYTTLRYFHPFIDALVCMSASTVKDSILRHSSVSPAKIHHVPLGVDEVFTHPPGVEEARHLVHERYTLPVPFIFAPGRVDSQKNIPRVVAAYAALLKNHPDLPHALVIGARHRPEEDRLVEELVAHHNLTSRIIHLPYVEDRDMPALYRAADLTIYPSLHEGFGLPILESMAAGTPVITSTVYSMPEIAGEAALLVDPTDVSALAAAMSRLLTDARLHERFSELGKKNVQRYSWSRMAEQTASIYRQVAEKR